MNVIVEREKGPLAELEARITALRERGSGDSTELEEKYRSLLTDLFGSLTPWERVNMARHPKRPLSGDYVDALDQFDELHGDRHFRDDRALVGGFAKLNGRRIVVLAQQKGRDTKENIKRNFGMVSPRRLPEGEASDRTRVASAATDRHVRRYVGCRSRHRIGRARAVRSDRRVSRGALESDRARRCDDRR